MSIAGISSASSAAYIQQAKDTSRVGVAAQTTLAEAVAPAQSGQPRQSAPTEQPGPNPTTHHHHHGDAASSQLTQSGTTSASGTNVLNTLV
jgi:hypothetical protein